MHIEGEIGRDAAGQISEDELELVQQARIERDILRPYVPLRIVGYEVAKA